MNMIHVSPFLDGMHRKDPTTLAQHLSREVVLFSPFIEAPFKGRDAVLKVLGVLLSAVDEFESTAIIADQARAAIMLRIRVGDTEVTGVDDMTIDGSGLIDSMSIQWRPLANIVKIQQRLAPLIGVPALELVEKRAS
jgi:hypothetical protein